MAYLSDRFQLDETDLSDKSYHQFDKLVSDTLESLGLIGRLQSDPDIVGLLVPLDNALAEIRHQFELPSFSRSSFERVLRKNEIHIFNTIDELNSYREAQKQGKHSKLSRLERGNMISELKKLTETIEVSPNRIQYHSRPDRMVIQGKDGFVYLDDIGSIVVEYDPKERSPRKWSATKNKFDFMSLDVDYGDSTGRFKTTKKLSKEDTEIIRERLSIKKSGSGGSRVPHNVVR